MIITKYYSLIFCQSRSLTVWKALPFPENLTAWLYEVPDILTVWLHEVPDSLTVWLYEVSDSLTVWLDEVS